MDFCESIYISDVSELSEEIPRFELTNSASCAIDTSPDVPSTTIHILEISCPGYSTESVTIFDSSITSIGDKVRDSENFGNRISETALLHRNTRKWYRVRKEICNESIGTSSDNDQSWYEKKRFTHKRKIRFREIVANFLLKCKYSRLPWSFLDFFLIFFEKIFYTFYQLLFMDYTLRIHHFQILSRMFAYFVHFFHNFSVQGCSIVSQTLKGVFQKVFHYF